MCILKSTVYTDRSFRLYSFLCLLFQIPVTPLSDWPVPREQNNSCLNVVKKVIFFKMIV